MDVEQNGEAYYVNPDDLKGYYLNRPADAFRIMRELGLGITNNKLFASRTRPYKSGTCELLILKFI